MSSPSKPHEPIKYIHSKMNKVVSHIALRGLPWCRGALWPDLTLSLEVTGQISIEVQRFVVMHFL